MELSPAVQQPGQYQAAPAAPTMAQGFQYFGNAPEISTIDPRKIDIVYSAEPFKHCCYCCVPGGGAPRTYFHVLENALERNTACVVPWPCMKPSCCCTQVDTISKAYFDRGPFDTQTCCFAVGCLKGDPSATASMGRFECCRQPCPECYNQCVQCRCPDYCGDTVSVKPFDIFCFCCSNESEYNCCNCWGFCFCPMLSPGQALVQFPLWACLAVGEQDRAVEIINNTRNAWKKRNSL